MPHIPFNRPTLTGKEFDYIRQSIDSGQVSGDGTFTSRCHQLLQSELDVASVLLTTSCTHALEMSALLLNIKPGDEVIIPSFTFVSTVNAFVIHGATPVFADIRPDTLNIDETLIESLITPRTKAIVVVHYAGISCEMDSIMASAALHGIDVIEDNAHGLFGQYKQRKLGSIGRMATQSFHETKNVICGEGGALLINDPCLIERAEIIREKGTNRSKFFRGQVDKYGWVDVGSSYLPSDILAAFLFAQLESRHAIQLQRQTIWQSYNSQLASWAGNNNIALPTVPPHCQQPYHMFYLLLPSLASRTSLINHLKERDILAVFHYLPLHLSPMAQQLGCTSSHCPITEQVSDHILRLPFFNDMKDDEQQQVIDATLQWNQ